MNKHSRNGSLNGDAYKSSGDATYKVDAANDELYTGFNSQPFIW